MMIVISRPSLSLSTLAVLLVVSLSNTCLGGKIIRAHQINLAVDVPSSRYPAHVIVPRATTDITSTSTTTSSSARVLPSLANSTLLRPGFISSGSLRPIWLRDITATTSLQVSGIIPGQLNPPSSSTSSSAPPPPPTPAPTNVVTVASAATAPPAPTPNTPTGTTPNAPGIAPNTQAPAASNVATEPAASGNGGTPAVNSPNSAAPFTVVSVNSPGSQVAGSGTGSGAAQPGSPTNSAGMPATVLNTVATTLTPLSMGSSGGSLASGATNDPLVTATQGNLSPSGTAQITPAAASVVVISGSITTTIPATQGQSATRSGIQLSGSAGGQQTSTSTKSAGQRTINAVPILAWLWALTSIVMLVR
ncbi:hypothetical protein EHS25_000143 [Saitozyma podzolica]|uniref:Uncharacterized protein n=1 Tax=Saitozyma podzolica TaxID=1890683 RepID=A0A427YVD7_9TREE|nr:hypothetical protein EHS25_000143 [Saitozyma podzolica]